MYRLSSHNPATLTVGGDGEGISKRALTAAEVSAPFLGVLLQHSMEASLGKNKAMNWNLFPWKSHESRSHLQQYQRNEIKGQALPPHHTLHDYFMQN